MAVIRWAQICELAFLDSFDRLCMVGVMTRFVVRSFPTVATPFMIAVRVAEMVRGEAVTIGISMNAPNGLTAIPDQGQGVQADISADYILLRLRSAPLSGQGTHAFNISVGDGEPFTLEIPVLLVSVPPDVKLHPSEEPLDTNQPWSPPSRR